MGDKSRHVLLIIGGGYLIYTGSRLISEVLKSHPSSETMFLVFGAFFIIFGVLIVGINLKKIYDLKKEEKESDIVVEDIDFPEGRTQSVVQKERRAGSNVQMVKLKPEESEELETEEAEEDFTDEEEAFGEDDDEYLDDDEEECEEESDEDLFEVKLERI